MKKKFIAMIFIGALIVVSIPAGLVSAQGKTYRPLSDWAINNPSIFLGWKDEFAGYVFFIENYPAPGGPPTEGTYDGYIRERVMRDGTAELTLVIRGENLRFRMCIWEGTPGDPSSAVVHFGEWLLEDAYMEKYYVKVKFTLPEPGALIPNAFELMANGQINYWYVRGKGSGTFTEYAEGFPLGETGYVKALFIGLFKLGRENEKIGDKLHYGAWLIPPSGIKLYS